MSVFNVLELLEKAKLFLKEYSVFIGWLVSVVLDTKYNLLEMFIQNPDTVNTIRVMGAALLAYMTENGLKSKLLISKENGK
jgi:hypothetical protein